MLAFDVVPGADPRPGHVAFLLHGILGSARNWRAFARTLAAAAPDWRFVTVDLRHHGDSHGQAAPDSLRACAEDLLELAAETGPPRVLFGHSFGGKVALSAVGVLPSLRGVGVLDAVPTPVPPHDLGRDVLSVLEAVERISMPVAHHDVVRDALVGAGLGPAVAGWMTTNLVRRGDGLVWRFDLAHIRGMLAAYAETDVTDALHQRDVEVRILRAGRSGRWTEQAVAATAGVDVTVLPEAGHWVHVDAPDATLRWMVDGLSAWRVRDASDLTNFLRMPHPAIDQV